MCGMKTTSVLDDLLDVLGTQAMQGGAAMDAEFFVPGIPVPKGSAKAFMSKGMRFPIVMQDNRERQKPWASAIGAAASQHFTAPREGPITLYCSFLMPRPKGHFGVKGLRPSAPQQHTVKPDLDKLIRCLKDALTGIAWRDDSQVIRVVASKTYSPATPGVTVRIEALEGGA